MKYSEQGPYGLFAFKHACNYHMCRGKNNVALSDSARLREGWNVSCDSDLMVGSHCMPDFQTNLLALTADYLSLLGTQTQTLIQGSTLVTRFA